MKILVKTMSLQILQFGKFQAFQNFLLSVLKFDSFIDFHAHFSSREDCWGRRPRRT